MGWIEGKSVWDHFASENRGTRESPGEVVGVDEVEEMRLDLFAAEIVVPLDGSFLDSLVYAEASSRTLALLGKIRELDAVVGEHRVDAIRNGFHKCFQEGRCGLHVGSLGQLDEGEFGSASGVSRNY